MRRSYVFFLILVAIVAAVIIYGGAQIKDNERAIAQADAFIEEMEAGYED